MSSEGRFREETDIIQVPVMHHEIPNGVMMNTMEDGTKAIRMEEGSRSTLPEWTQDSAHVVDWDDGFCPSGCNQAQSKMVINQKRSKPNWVSTWDDVLTSELADQFYESAMAQQVWGVYVNMKDFAVFKEQEKQKQAFTVQEQENMNEVQREAYHKYLAFCAIKQFLVDRVGILLDSQDWEAVHGIVVWVIASNVGQVVEYHIDYAEMFRYQTNIIYPPMYGATLHVTRLEKDDDMTGGDFLLNTRGLNHYKECGYKNRFNGGSNENLDTLCSSWIQVPYKFNRAILCDGDFPHYSSRVTKLPAHKKRVIIGFNLFNHEIGPFAEAYPEHSTKFNKFIKMSQAINNTTPSHKRITLKEVAQNPKLAAFLKFLLRKSKEKQIVSVHSGETT